MSKNYTYLLLNKPYGYLSQFTKEHESHKTLADLVEVESDIYPVGRLDKDSEGLLILTNDKSVNHLLLDPKYAHKRTYWVQVEGVFTPDNTQSLLNGVNIRTKKKHHFCRVTDVRIIDHIDVPPRNPPIRFRKNIPTTWISITLTEGKNRQVRKMCAAIGKPILRLIRYSIEHIKLDGIPVGDYQEVDQKVFLKLTKLSK